MAAGLWTTAKAVEHLPEPKVGAPVSDPPNDVDFRSLLTVSYGRLCTVLDYVKWQGRNAREALIGRGKGRFRASHNHSVFKKSIREPGAR
jgi:hypothetical protein